jgi:hypothetical protein
VRVATEEPSALVVMAPLKDGREEQLLATLGAMPTGQQSPFARVASTHFARWLLIAALLGPDGEPTGPAQPYLLFTADFDDSLDRWAAAVAGVIGPDVDRVFDHCHGYPGTSDAQPFLDFICEHRVDVGFSIVSSHATVATIRRSLALRHALREFAVASQGLRASELRSAWRERFAQ